MKPQSSCAAVAIAMLVFHSLPGAAQEAETMAAFAVGRGGRAARAAVDVQRALRQVIPTTGTYESVDVQQVLEPGSGSARMMAVDEGRALLAEGKTDYEQLDLEQAQAKFRSALKKFEYGYAYLARPAPLVECLMYLAATWALVGEPNKALRFFLRAHDLPGRKRLDPSLFPPNIQEIFTQASQQTETARRGSVRLITVPQGAEVHVDDVYRGGSPVKVDGLRADVHLVRAVKDGYRSWGGRVKVSAGKIRAFRMQLRPAKRHKEFSRLYQKMVAEVLKDEPAEATVELAGFLNARYIAVVSLEGQPIAMTLRGFRCDVREMKLAAHQEVLDSTAPDFEDRLKAYASKLLTSTTRPGEQPDEAYSEGEAAAAALLATADDVEAGDEGGLGLDLGEGGGEKPPPEEKTTAVVGGEDAIRAEEVREEKLAAAIKEEARKQDEKRTDEEESTWSYLSGEWWFWTAIGVVAAGAATTTYLLVQSGDEGGGTLVLDLH